MPLSDLGLQGLVRRGKLRGTFLHASFKVIMGITQGGLRPLTLDNLFLELTIDRFELGGAR